jgi:NTE family protein
MKTINLVLSGGGARGIAHLGVIKALLEAGYEIHAISGVSSGAIAGAFIAKGMSPDEVLEIALSNADFNIRRPPFRLGFFTKHTMEHVLQKYFPVNSFEDLKIPLTISATNINTSATDYFSSGELIKPLLASSAIPVLYAPVEINGFQYLDGGMINNLPVEPFMKDERMRVGVHVNPVCEKKYFSSLRRIIERSIELSVHKNISSRLKHCHLAIEPQELIRFLPYDFAKAKEIFRTGYDFTRIVLEKFALMDEEEEIKNSKLNAA